MAVKRKRQKVPFSPWIIVTWALAGVFVALASLAHHADDGVLVWGFGVSAFLTAMTASGVTVIPELRSVAGLACPVSLILSGTVAVTFSWWFILALFAGVPWLVVALLRTSAPRRTGGGLHLWRGGDD
ncbi:hypothetical protein [Corynebacterium pygosceleis]|uniref:hypothetical protein n=1 Tax=Corynebacterium pygosceleis TaxID=2800406 RepID=UPI0019041DB9|nr:hypothetical protein [Corynebacterium pygosceleis]MCK7675871.1 hypothetical protein [Corynebacterium pygosceleis]MCL0120747.1 hypothetical protein [Corynebacterium pygosceleis]